jgi:hypothetical protein
MVLSDVLALFSIQTLSVASFSGNYTAFSLYRFAPYNFEILVQASNVENSVDGFPSNC